MAIPVGTSYVYPSVEEEHKSNCRLQNSPSVVLVDSPPSWMALKVESLKKNSAYVYEKVEELSILAFKIILAGVLAWNLPIIFPIGIFIGVEFKEKALESMNKVIDVWNAQTWATKLLIGVGCYLSLAGTTLVATSLYSTYLGSLLADQIAEQKESEAPCHLAAASFINS